MEFGLGFINSAVKEGATGGVTLGYGNDQTDYTKVAYNPLSAPINFSAAGDPRKVDLSGVSAFCAQQS